MLQTDLEHPASRASRLRRDAADRARKWRGQQREASETDHAIVVAMMRVARGGEYGGRRTVQIRSAFEVRDVIAAAVQILQSQGAPFDEAKQRVGERLEQALKSDD